MSAEGEEKRIGEPVREMQQDESRMGDRLEELEEDIDEAKKTAERRQDAPDPGIVAGDWRDASTGAHTGQDPHGAIDEDRDEEDRRGRPEGGAFEEER